MKQSKALEILKSGATTFLTGEPGAGKTYVINMFTEWCRENGISYAVTASTGIAATHINGVTIHSWAGIGIKKEITDHDLDLILAKEYVTRQVLAARVLIIDEISMLNAQTLNNVDRVLSAIHGTTLTGEPFGGLQVIFVGDFYQLPPVSRDEKVEFAFQAKSWKAADPVTCYLTEQHRQNDELFLGILKNIRDGKVNDNDKKHLLNNEGKEIPNTKLYTHNADVDRINEDELSKIKDHVFVYTMTSRGIPFMVDTLKKNCLSPELLRLKIGALVMFTRNNFEEGYVNGTLGKVVGRDGHYPIVETKSGKRIVAKESEWSIKEGEYEKAAIQQIPLRLAWAVTIHKSQGMSLDAAMVDLSRSFEYGQGYVAISRVCSLSGLYLEGMNEKALEMHPQVIAQDVLFRESSDLMETKF